MSGLEGVQRGSSEGPAEHGQPGSVPLFNHPAPFALSFVPRPVAAPTPHQSPGAHGERPTTLLWRPPEPGADNGELDSICPDDLGADKGH